MVNWPVRPLCTLPQISEAVGSNRKSPTKAAKGSRARTASPPRLPAAVGLPVGRAAFIELTHTLPKTACR